MEPSKEVMNSECFLEAILRPESKEVGQGSPALKGWNKL
jgi:hypothetical protein